MRHCTKNSTCGQRGFSLIEVIIVVAITLILMAMTAKSMMSAVANYRLSSATRNIGALAQLAKIKATSRDTRYRVAINTSALTYRLERWNRSSNSWETDPGSSAINLPPGVSYVTTAVSTPPAGQSAGPDTEMVFNNRGLLVASSGTPPPPVSSRCFYLTGQVPRGMAVCSNIAGKTIIYRAIGSTWQVQ